MSIATTELNLINLHIFSYLNEALINLNMSDPITREHAPKILRELYNTFQTFIATHPANQLNSSMKMIMLAAQSISNM